MRFSPFQFGLWARLTDRLGGWVHPSIQAGTAEFERHASYIAMSIVVGSAAMALSPAYVGVFGISSALDALLLLALASPLFAALAVSRTGSLTVGERASLATLTVILTLTVLMTGGVASPLLALFVIVPVEASQKEDSKALKFGIGCVALASVFVFLTADSVAPGSYAVPGYAVAGLILVYGISLSTRLSKWRHSAQYNLQAEQDRFRLIAQNATDLITTHDLNGATLFASPAARLLCGQSASVLLQSGFFEQIHLQDRVQFLKALSNAVHDERCSTFQVRLRNKGDTSVPWKWVEMRTHLASRTDGEKPAVVAVTRDITRSKSHEAALREAAEKNEAAHNAQRRFIMTMSHELRTPLNAVIGFSDILRQELFGTFSDKRQAEYVGLIHDSGQHLLQVVNDMLDMSRIEAGKYELSLGSFHLSEIAAATVNMLAPMAQNDGVFVTKDPLTDLPEIVADKRACQQILINLVSNAIKFTPEGGSVRITAKQHGRSIKLRVQDTGIGIDEGFLKVLGQPFMQADHGRGREFEGSGIGLSVVKGLVSLHGGKFEVHSTKGEGTTVTVTLPLKAAIARPIPANQGAQLVRLNAGPSSAAAQLTPSKKLVSTREYEGDNRARVSA